MIRATATHARGVARKLLAAGHRLHAPVHNAGPDRARRLSGPAFVRVPIAQVQAQSPDRAAMYAFLTEEPSGIDVPGLRMRYPEVDWLCAAGRARDGGLSAEADRRLSPAETSADV